MIDPENEVYTRVANALAVDYPKADISGTYQESPAAFPHVFCEMSDNSLTSGCQTSSDGEDCVDVMFTFKYLLQQKSRPEVRG